MQPLELNVSTVVVLVVIASLVVLALRRMLRRGLCDCDDRCGDGGCSKCGAADKMVKDMEKAAKGK